MLGSTSVADDAVQETWLRISRSDTPFLVVGGGQVRVAFAFTITDGRITAIDLLADPERLQTLNITLLA